MHSQGMRGQISDLPPLAIWNSTHCTLRRCARVSSTPSDAESIRRLNLPRIPDHSQSASLISHEEACRWDLFLVTPRSFTPFIVGLQVPVVQPAV